MSEQLKTEVNEFSPQGFEPVPNLHWAMGETKDYADRNESNEYITSHEQLREIGNFWAIRRHDPETSPRALQDIELLIGRVSFELVMRQQELTNGA